MAVAKVLSFRVLLVVASLSLVVFVVAPSFLAAPAPALLVASSLLFVVALASSFLVVVVDLAIFHLVWYFEEKRVHAST